MHFVGMLALRLPVPVRYDPAITLLSMLPALAASAAALALISRESIGLARTVVGGIVLGGGVGVMHDTGMAAMVMKARVA
jgi:NO-binding membrane sensor protein with MHYT domain